MKKITGSFLFTTAVFGLAACGGNTANVSNTSVNTNRMANNVAVVVNDSTANANSMTGVNTLNTANSTGNTSSALSDGDKKFMNESAQGGMAEVKLGELASQKGADAEVKAFGKKMVEDHSNANTELKSLATKKSLTLPADVNAEQKAMYDKLAKLSGAEFDKEYVKGMVEDHEKDVAAFKKQAESGQDADAKAFAAKTLPTLQKHFDSIKAIQAKMK